MSESSAGPPRRFPRVFGQALLSLLLFFGAACVPFSVQSAIHPGSSTPMPGGGVGLHVIHAPGGSVLAYTAVYINGKGPYDFAVDTGASKSVIGSPLANDLQLPHAGKFNITISPGTQQATLLRVDDWRLDGVNLPATTVASMALPQVEQLTPPGSHGLQGLLGSDVLSTFGAVTIDYDAGRLMLGSGDAPASQPD